MKITDVCTDCGKPLNEHTCPGEKSEAETDPIAVAAAVLAANRERDRALTELADLKLAIGWTMGKLRVNDLFRARGSVEIPVASPDFLPGLFCDPKDTERIDFINAHGRVGVGQHGQFIFALDSKVHLGSAEGNSELDARIPTIFNFRHFVDMCRSQIEKTLSPVEEIAAEIAKDATA